MYIEEQQKGGRETLATDATECVLQYSFVYTNSQGGPSFRLAGAVTDADATYVRPLSCNTLVVLEIVLCLPAAMLIYVLVNIPNDWML